MRGFYGNLRKILCEPSEIIRKRGSCGAPVFCGEIWVNLDPYFFECLKFPINLGEFILLIIYLLLLLGSCFRYALVSFTLYLSLMMILPGFRGEIIVT